jgi:hypothetical protein
VSDSTTAARPSPRRTFEESGTTSVQGSSLSSWIRAGRSPPSSSLESWTPTLPQPRSPQPHNGTGASRKLPSSDSITATPSDSSGLPAHASTLSGSTHWPVQVTTSLRPRRTPMSAHQSSPPSISTCSARTLQPSPARCRSSGLAVTTSAMKPSYEGHRGLLTRWGERVRLAVVVIVLGPLGLDVRVDRIRDRPVRAADCPTGRRRAGVPPKRHRARGPTARTRA